MNAQIFATVTNVQEALIALQEEDEYLRKVMRTTASVEELAPHFRMIRHYVSKLHLLLNDFESESMSAQLFPNSGDVEEGC